VGRVLRLDLQADHGVGRGVGDVRAGPHDAQVEAGRVAGHGVGREVLRIGHLVAVVVVVPEVRQPVAVDVELRRGAVGRGPLGAVGHHVVVGVGPQRVAGPGLPGGVLDALQLQPVVDEVVVGVASLGVGAEAALVLVGQAVLVGVGGAAVGGGAGALRQVAAAAHLRRRRRRCARLRGEAGRGFAGQELLQVHRVLVRGLGAGAPRPFRLGGLGLVRGEERDAPDAQQRPGHQAADGHGDDGGVDLPAPAVGQRQQPEPGQEAEAGQRRDRVAPQPDHPGRGAAAGQRRLEPPAAVGALRGARQPVHLPEVAEVDRQVGGRVIGRADLGHGEVDDLPPRQPGLVDPQLAPAGHALVGLRGREGHLRRHLATQAAHQEVAHVAGEGRPVQVEAVARHPPGGGVDGVLAPDVHRRRQVGHQIGRRRVDAGLLAQRHERVAVLGEGAAAGAQQRGGAGPALARRAAEPGPGRAGLRGHRQPGAVGQLDLALAPQQHPLVLPPDGGRHGAGQEVLAALGLEAVAAGGLRPGDGLAQAQRRRRLQPFGRPPAVHRGARLAQGATQRRRRRPGQRHHGQRQGAEGGQECGDETPGAGHGFLLGSGRGPSSRHRRRLYRLAGSSQRVTGASTVPPVPARRVKRKCSRPGSGTPRPG
jgi:hypothetical protein